MRLVKALNTIKDYKIKLLYFDDEAGNELLQVGFVNRESGEEYVVACDEGGFWYCNCPDFQYRHNKEEEVGSFICKHIIMSIRWFWDFILFKNEYMED